MSELPWVAVVPVISIGAIAVFLVWIIQQSVVVVGGHEIAVLERRYFGKPMPGGRVIAMPGEVGVQARTLGPGVHFLAPFLFRATKVPFVVVDEGSVGLVESIDGAPIQQGHIFARVTAGHNFFQDAESFLQGGGEKGPQVGILPPGNYRINTALFRVALSPVVVIESGRVGMVESVDGAPIPQGRIFARITKGHNSFQDAEAFLQGGGEKGPQVGVLPPGKYRINTALFRVTVAENVIIQPGKVGTVTSMDGEAIPSGRLLARAVAGHSSFENGEAFLSQGGQRGPQIDVLLPGTYRININLFGVKILDATTIPSAKVGLVTALDGSPLPENEFVATRVDGHSDYQNATAFLAAGGQRGPQLDVLRPGVYYVNPLMFSVALDDVTEVERGQVAVIVSNVGREPARTADGNGSGQPMTEEKTQERYVVPEGFRGIQREVLGPGRYYVNKRAFMAYIIDTTNITLDWDNEAKTRFDPLKVISKDGFPIDVAVKVVVRVRPEQAPFMVAKIGSVDNLIDHVIHPMIDSSFRNQASSTSAMNFMQDRQEEQHKAEDRTRLELEKYHVECVSVLICQINLPQELMDTQTKKIIAQQQMQMYDAEGQAQEQRAATEKKRAQAEMQPKLVEAEIGVEIAEQNRKRTVIAAEAEGESKRLNAQGEAAGIKAIGEAEASKTLAIGKSTAEAYELQNRAIGGAGVTAIEIAKQIAVGQIKITPDLLVQGGEGLSGLLSAYLSRRLTSQSDTDV